MTNHYNLTKKFRKKETIAVCMLCDKHRIDNEWIDYPRQDYREYTHTYCDECLDIVVKYNKHLRRQEEQMIKKLEEKISEIRRDLK